MTNNQNLRELENARQCIGEVRGVLGEMIRSEGVCPFTVSAADLYLDSALASLSRVEASDRPSPSPSLGEMVGGILAASRPPARRWRLIVAIGDALAAIRRAGAKAWRFVAGDRGSALPLPDPIPDEPNAPTAAPFDLPSPLAGGNLRPTCPTCGAKAGTPCKVPMSDWCLQRSRPTVGLASGGRPAASPRS